MWEGTTYHPLPQCPDPALIWIKQRVECPMIELAGSHADAIHLAAQVGRLDIVSLMLTMFGLLLAVGALIGFWMIRSAAIDAAKEEATRYLEKEGARLFGEVAETKGKGPNPAPNIDTEDMDEAGIIENATEVSENGQENG